MWVGWYAKFRYSFLLSYFFLFVITRSSLWSDIWSTAKWKIIFFVCWRGTDRSRRPLFKKKLNLKKGEVNKPRRVSCPVLNATQVFDDKNKMRKRLLKERVEVKQRKCMRRRLRSFFFFLSFCFSFLLLVLFVRLLLQYCVLLFTVIHCFDVSFLKLYLDSAKKERKIFQKWKSRERRCGGKTIRERVTSTGLDSIWIFTLRCINIWIDVVKDGTSIFFLFSPLQISLNYSFY